MKQSFTSGITRRQAIVSLGAITAGAFIKPRSIFGAEPVQKRIRFAVMGDWGSGDNSENRVISRMTENHKGRAFDFVIGAGDNIYPDGSGSHFERNFEMPFAGFIKDKIQFYTVLGNHDVHQGRQDECSYPLFNMGGGCYYTLKKGDGLAEFFMLDSTDFSREQALWLDGALKASTALWKIAVFHHPIYSSGKTHGSDLNLRKKLEPILTKYGVKVGLSGHDHIYERTKPRNGIQYFVTGAGGKVRHNGTDLSDPLREVSFDDDNHFMVIEIDEKQFAFQAVSEDGKVVDSGAVKQG
ncbi:MAG TPA: metallophosphoesterase [Blastocatellia bacterium]